MNVFFIFTLWRIPVIRNYFFIWRIDADLRILSSSCDVFSVMKQNGYEYGMYYPHSDCNQAELKRAVQLYHSQMQILPDPSFDALRKHVSYGGAFGVFSVDIWTQDNFLNMASFITVMDGIYENRWADQNFYPLVFHTFRPASKVHQFKGWKFLHKGGPLWTSLENSTDEHCKLTK